MCNSHVGFEYFHKLSMKATHSVVRDVLRINTNKNSCHNIFVIDISEQTFTLQNISFSYYTFSRTARDMKYTSTIKDCTHDDVHTIISHKENILL